MALIKAITLNNGIVVNYHRVVSVNNITNHASIIEIASYISKEKRQEEKEALKNNEPMDMMEIYDDEKKKGVNSKIKERKYLQDFILN